MTTITIDRAVVEQALDFVVATNKSSQFWLVPESNLNKTVTALRAALAQPAPHGCHVDLAHGRKPDGCVLDDGRPENCIYAKRLLREGKDKTACEYWQPIEVTR